MQLIGMFMGAHRLPQMSVTLVQLGLVRLRIARYVGQEQDV